MKLLKLKLVNFRTFYGEHELEFATDETKNVTVIHGENGFGKTTILNALRWCFYGNTTQKFEQKDKLINFSAKKEGNVTRVEVTFEHLGEQYRAFRHDKGGRRTKDSFFVQEIDKHGSLKEKNSAPKALITSMIPENMVDYFFFDGEDAATFASEDNQGKVSGAIKKMLGIDAAELVVKDFDDLTKKENDEIKENTKNKELAAEVERLNEQREKIKTNEEEIKSLKDRNALLEEMRIGLKEDLKGLEETAELQKNVERLEEELKEFESQEKDKNDEWLKWLAYSAVAVSSATLRNQAKQILEKAEERGEIPSPYNEEFVQKILKNLMCICGREISEGSQEYEDVKKLLDTASTSVIQKRILSARARIEFLERDGKVAWKTLEKIHNDQDEIEREIGDKEKRIFEIGENLKNIDNNEVANKQTAIEKATNEKDKNHQKIGALTERLRILKMDEEKLEKEIDNLTKKEEKLKIHRFTKKFIEDAKTYLKKTISSHEENAKKKIELDVNELLKKIAFKDYRLEIKDDYKLNLSTSDEDQVPIPKSSGENQLLSLAFIAAFIQFSRDAKEEHSPPMRRLPSIMAPLVLDSPFGQLGDEYKRATAKFIPKMASQVIMLLSSSQGDDEVMNAISDKIGKEYLLVQESTKKRGLEKQAEIALGGKSYTFLSYDCERDCTKIQEVGE
ncbi:MAG: ATP-binding protein [Candidatus Eutrophobiaceae bacterium]